MNWDNRELDALFAEARAAQPAAPSADLLARVLGDAYAAQPPAAPAAPLPAPGGRPRGWLAGIGGLFGGGAALAGLVSAGLAGLVIGLMQPAPVSAFTGAVTGAVTGVWTNETPLETVELIPGFDGWTGVESDG